MLNHPQPQIGRLSIPKCVIYGINLRYCMEWAYRDIPRWHYLVTSGMHIQVVSETIAAASFRGGSVSMISRNWKMVFGWRDIWNWWNPAFLRSDFRRGSLDVLFADDSSDYSDSLLRRTVPTPSPIIWTSRDLPGPSRESSPCSLGPRVRVSEFCCVFVECDSSAIHSSRLQKKILGEARDESDHVTLW